MANIRNGNTFYIDTQFSTNEELAVRNIKVTHVAVTANAANGRIELKDSSLALKADLRVATSGETKVFDFSDNPLLFSTSIRPQTLSNAIVTCVIRESRQ